MTERNKILFDMWNNGELKDDNIIRTLSDGNLSGKELQEEYLKESYNARMEKRDKNIDRLVFKISVEDPCLVDEDGDEINEDYSFDIPKVVNVMKDLDWKWADHKTGGLATVTIERFREQLQDLVYDAVNATIKQYENRHETGTKVEDCGMTTGTGGIMVHAYIDPDDKMLCVDTWFELEGTSHCMDLNKLYDENAFEDEE